MYKALHMNATKQVMNVTVITTKKKKRSRKSTRRSEATVGHNKTTKVA